LFGRIKPAAIAPSLGRGSVGEDVVAEVLDLYRRVLFEET
jgi:hypothetical protein